MNSRENPRTSGKFFEIQENFNEHMEAPGNFYELQRSSKNSTENPRTPVKF